jgi:alginate O-acetyltransferase complex protein AlgI
MNVAAVFDVLLRLAGAGHFVILIASAQVPGRLRWREELAALSPLNRKFMWVQGAFTVLTIVAFGALTFVLRGELLRGERAALALATFIAFYWTARIAVDAFVFSHADWPRGRGMVVGHVLLTALFVALAATYGALVAWHALA